MAEKTTPPDSNVCGIARKLARHFQQNVWIEDIKDYADYIVYNSNLDREGNPIPAWQTNGTIPIARMHNDVMFSSVYDNVLQSRVSGRTTEDHKKADNARNFVEWGMSRWWSRKELIEAAKEAIVCWEWYAFMGFKNETETIKYKGKWNKPMKKVTTEQYPFLEFVSTYDIMFDPTAPSFYKSKYVIRKRVEHLDDIKARYKTFIKDFEVATKSADAGAPIFGHDYNRVKFAMMNQRDWIGGPTPSTTGWAAKAAEDGTFNGGINLDFLNKNVKNQLTINYSGGFYEVVEYWEKKKFILLLNGIEVHNWPNPFPVERIPFVQLLSNKIPGCPFSVSNSQAIRHVTKTIDRLMNLTVDNITLNVIPMFESAQWTDIDLQGKDFLDMIPFKVYKTTTAGSIKKLNLGTGDFSWVNLTQFFIQIAEMISGSSGYAIGYQNKVERSATGVSALTSASKTRLNEFMDSMNIALGMISEFWIQCGVAVLPNEISIKVDDPDTGIHFYDITIEDIIGKFDFEFDAKALKTATRELQRAQAMKLLELAAQIAVNPVTGQAYVNIPELFKVVVDSFEFDGKKIVLTVDEAVQQQGDAAVAAEKGKFKTQKKLEKVGQRYAKKGWFNAQGFWAQSAWGGPLPPAEDVDGPDEDPTSFWPWAPGGGNWPGSTAPETQGDVLSDVLN